MVAGAEAGAAIGAAAGAPVGGVGAIPGAIGGAIGGAIVGLVTGFALKPLKNVLFKWFEGTDAVLKQRRDQVQQKAGPLLDKASKDYQDLVDERYVEVTQSLNDFETRTLEHSDRMAEVAEVWRAQADVVHNDVCAVDLETAACLLRVQGRDRLASSLRRVTRVPGVGVLAELAEPGYTEAVLFPPDIGESFLPGIYATGKRLSSAILYAGGLSKGAEFARYSKDSVVITMPSEIPEPVLETWADALSEHLGGRVRLEPTKFGKRNLMSDMLFKSALSTARALSEELRSLLAEVDPPAATPFLTRLQPDPHALPRLVFTGQYSSGKSTLIQALTNDEAGAEIGAGIVTGDVTEYPWDGDVVLVDTPGVFAGHQNHDRLAEEALQQADLVLFTVTVELFDDILVNPLRDVLGRLGKAHQTMVVVTKEGTRILGDNIVEAAIRDAVGTAAIIPWIKCDAQDYRDGDVEGSHLDAVVKLINDFARKQGEFGRVSQPLQLIASLTSELQAQLSDDPEEASALIVLARQRSALTRKRAHLDGLLEAEIGTFRATAIRAADAFADGAERLEENGGSVDGSEPEALIADLNGRLEKALVNFQKQISRVIELQYDDLASEIKEIEASPHARAIVQLEQVQAGEATAVDISVSPVTVSASGPAVPAWAGDITNHLSKFRDFWGAGGGVKAAAGSNGHKVVLKIGHAFGKKFEPWQAVRWSNTVGKVAKMGGEVIEL